ncbi:hypothetical protein Gogos_003457, partial [Gossypium gossypioides]|nr:hypothetical protein [Gossypium gossypioides]
MDLIEVWDFLDYSFIDENTSPDILLPNYSSGREIVVHQEKEFVDSDCSRKRGRSGSCSRPGTKACREKLRREKLNERFLDLSSTLEPGRPARTDKSAILDDAIRVLTQLRTDAQELKETNEKLLEEIKSLKRQKEIFEKLSLESRHTKVPDLYNCLRHIDTDFVDEWFLLFPIASYIILSSFSFPFSFVNFPLQQAEKNEIREEKLVLKANKERIEQQLKTLNVSPAGYLPAHPAGYHAAANKMAVFPGYGLVPMWQYLPPSARDTSQDHELRPPA